MISSAGSLLYSRFLSAYCKLNFLSNSTTFLVQAFKISLTSGLVNSTLVLVGSPLGTIVVILIDAALTVVVFFADLSKKLLCAKLKDKLNYLG